MGGGAYWAASAELADDREASRPNVQVGNPFLEKLLLEACLALLPKVVRISPADGAANVDPATTELVVEFDRPMRRTSCAVTGSPDKTPKANGQFRFSEDGKTFTLPVTLVALGDIYWLARQRLVRQGVSRIYGGGECTVTDSTRCFSYRRDGQTGRQGVVVRLPESL